MINPSIVKYNDCFRSLDFYHDPCLKYDNEESQKTFEDTENFVQILNNYSESTIKLEKVATQINALNKYLGAQLTLETEGKIRPDESFIARDDEHCKVLESIATLALSESFIQDLEEAIAEMDEKAKNFPPTRTNSLSAEDKPLPRKTSRSPVREYKRIPTLLRGGQMSSTPEKDFPMIAGSLRRFSNEIKRNYPSR